MKKLALLLVAVGLFVASCGTSRSTDSTTTDSVGTDTVATDTTRMERPQ